MDFARGIFELNYPKDRLQIVFALDDYCVSKAEVKINKFIELWPNPELCFVATTTLNGNDPQTSDIIPWKTRARFAAELRNLYTKFVVDYLFDSEYIFSVGSDIVIEPESLNILLNMNEKVASGLYISRVQERPLSLSYSDGKWSYDRVDVTSDEIFKADWSGLDCALIHRDVFSTVNWDNFTVEKYGVGEDGYFYLEAKERGFQLFINPQVRPLHVQDNGTVVAARLVSSIGLIVTCPTCGWKTKIGKRWKDITIQCPDCRSEFYADPFWTKRSFDQNAVGAGIASSSLK
jgi:hypothetical protein